MNPILLEGLKAIIRVLLAAAGGWMVERGVWTTGQADGIVDELVNYTVAGLLVLVPLAWSMLRTHAFHRTIEVARLMPAGTPLSVIREAVGGPDRV